MVHRGSGVADLHEGSELAPVDDQHQRHPRAGRPALVHRLGSLGRVEDRLII